jgi:hypothetical protein
MRFPPNWNMRDLCLQTPATVQNHRTTALGHMTHRSQWLDVNSHARNLRPESYAAIAAIRPTIVCKAPANAGTSVGATAEAGNSDCMTCGSRGSSEGGSAKNGVDTSDWPNAAHYTYVVAEGRHNLLISLSNGRTSLPQFHISRVSRRLARKHIMISFCAVGSGREMRLGSSGMCCSLLRSPQRSWLVDPTLAKDIISTIALGILVSTQWKLSMPFRPRSAMVDCGNSTDIKIGPDRPTE